MKTETTETKKTETMKEREIIRYMTGDIQAQMPDTEQVRANCLSRGAGANPAKGRLILRKPAAVIAIMVCLAMLVSATAVIISRTQYIPGKGFVEGTILVVMVRNEYFV